MWQGVVPCDAWLKAEPHEHAFAARVGNEMLGQAHDTHSYLRMSGDRRSVEQQDSGFREDLFRAHVFGRGLSIGVSQGGELFDS